MWPVWVGSHLAAAGLGGTGIGQGNNSAMKIKFLFGWVGVWLGTRWEKFRQRVCEETTEAPMPCLEECL